MYKNRKTIKIWKKFWTEKIILNKLLNSFLQVFYSILFKINVNFWNKKGMKTCFFAGFWLFRKNRLLKPCLILFLSLFKTFILGFMYKTGHKKTDCIILVQKFTDLPSCLKFLVSFRGFNRRISFKINADTTGLWDPSPVLKFLSSGLSFVRLSACNSLRPSLSRVCLLSQTSLYGISLMAQDDTCFFCHSEPMTIMGWRIAPAWKRFFGFASEWQRKPTRHLVKVK